MRAVTAPRLVSALSMALGSGGINAQKACWHSPRHIIKSRVGISILKCLISL
jgi:hypothetical protein